MVGGRVCEECGARHDGLIGCFGPDGPYAWHQAGRTARMRGTLDRSLCLVKVDGVQGWFVRGHIWIRRPHTRSTTSHGTIGCTWIRKTSRGSSTRGTTHTAPTDPRAQVRSTPRWPTRSKPRDYRSSFTTRCQERSPAWSGPGSCSPPPARTTGRDDLAPTCLDQRLGVHRLKAVLWRYAANLRERTRSHRVMESHLVLACVNPLSFSQMVIACGGSNFSKRSARGRLLTRS